MKYFTLGSCLVLLLSLSAFAQRRGGRNIPVAPPAGIPASSSGSFFLSGKVVLDDGTELTEPAAIQTVCHGQKHTEAFTDSHGNFSFEVGRASGANAAGFSDADSTWNGAAANRSRSLQDCELQAALAGFTSDSIALGSRISMGESNDLGRLALHRIAKVEGFTISATTAAAPVAARKAFEKGRKEEEKSHWDKAEESFQKAVDIYPRYAIAWFELGYVQQEKNNPEAARRSFHRSIAADPQYANPYRNLAQLAAIARQWGEVVELSSKLLSLNAVSFPDAWFFNSLGYYYQQNLESAEKSARQGIRVDEEHRLPKLEFLLGVLLAQRRQYGEAASHLRQYLRLVPAGVESDVARKQLEAVAQLAAAKDTPPVAPK